MEENKEVKPEVPPEGVPPVTETVEELKQQYEQRLENAKAENVRKSQEIQRLREEKDAARSASKEQVFNPQDLSTWKDHELKAVLKDPQYVALHDQATDHLERRRFERFQAEKDEQSLRMNSELERQQKYPETLDPSHPMAVRMSQLMHELRLERTPAGRLAAARIAASELNPSKAIAAGRKQEQDRQADVKANFQGEPSRPAPKVSDTAKIEALKKRAMSGDETARLEWFNYRFRGSVGSKPE